jgi:acetoin utilization deacetylase AcuC-like enzyme
MPVVWTDHHRLHDPVAEIWVGVRTPAADTPGRAERIREALAAQGATFVEAKPQPETVVTSVHDSTLLDYLAGAWDEWEAAGLADDPGQDRVVPYLFPHPSLFSGRPARAAKAITARAGQYAYDTMSLIGPGTYRAVRAAVDAAVTAADLVLSGAPMAYACCRPPGHHATRDCFGGSCYLNNSAAAAARLRSAGVGPVAVLDVDAHHGNGTQAIFWDDREVLTASVHVDPEAGWFPHFLGWEDETAGDTNRNITLPPGAGDERWIQAVADLAAWAAGSGARAVVAALGVDAARAAPESPLGVSARGFRAAGRVIGRLRLPTVVVQEGGYDLGTVGVLVHEALRGIEEGARGG